MPRLEEVGYYMQGLWLLLAGKAEGGLKADAADALACAITHAHNRKMNSLKQALKGVA